MAGFATVRVAGAGLRLRSSIATTVTEPSVAAARLPFGGPLIWGVELYSCAVGHIDRRIREVTSRLNILCTFVTITS